jgi:hypothetical protein
MRIRFRQREMSFPFGAEATAPVELPSNHQTLSAPFVNHIFPRFTAADGIWLTDADDPKAAKVSPFRVL